MLRGCVFLQIEKEFPGLQVVTNELHCRPRGHVSSRGTAVRCVPGSCCVCQNTGIPAQQMVYSDMLTFLLDIILARLAPEQNKHKMWFGEVCLKLPITKS